MGECVKNFITSVVMNPVRFYRNLLENNDSNSCFEFMDIIRSNTRKFPVDATRFRPGNAVVGSHNLRYWSFWTLVLIKMDSKYDNASLYRTY